MKLQRSVRARAQRCVSQLTHIFRCARQEVAFYPEHPPARDSNQLCGFAASFGHSAAHGGLARRLRTRSIARSEGRTIVTCSKSAPPSNLAPRRRRPKTRRPYSADYVFGAARPKCRQPRRRKTKREVPRPTMFSEGRGRQPRSTARALLVLRGGGTWVGLRSRAEGVPTAGGRMR